MYRSKNAAEITKTTCINSKTTAGTKDPNNRPPYKEDAHNARYGNAQPRPEQERDNNTHSRQILREKQDSEN
jgi:hypothetical protein